MLFDLDRIREENTKKNFYSSPFELLDNSSSECDKDVRAFLNKCFINYNDSSKNEILERIKENDEEKFHSTCFELIISYLFKLLGCTVEEHPNIDGSTKHPDFLITLETGESFYLELVTVGEYKDYSVAELKRFINEFKKDGKYINIKKIEGRDISQNNYQELRKFVKLWWHENKNIDNIFTKWATDDGSFEVDLEILKDGDIGIGFSMVEVNFHTALLNSLKLKAKKYGIFDKPYIIATTFRPSIYSAGLQFMQQLIINTLYGGRIFNLEKSVVEKQESLWDFDSTRIKNSNVSGILFFDELTASRAIEPIKYSLFINKKANYAIPSFIEGLFNHYYIDSENAYIFSNGLILHEVLKNSKLVD